MKGRHRTMSNYQSNLQPIWTSTSLPNTGGKLRQLGYRNDANYGTHYNNPDSKTSDVDFLYYELIYWTYFHINQWHTQFHGSPTSDTTTNVFYALCCVLHPSHFPTGSRFAQFTEEQNLASLPGIKSQSLGRSAHTWSPCRLCHPGTCCILHPVSENWPASQTYRDR